MSVSRSWILALVVLVSFTRRALSEPDISLTYCIENLKTSVEKQFQQCIDMTTEKKEFYDIMVEAAKFDYMFTFYGKCYDGLGFYVSEINSLTSIKDVYYWAFQKEISDKRCLLPVGVSSYEPTDGDKIVMSYEDIAAPIPQCNQEKNEL